MSGRWFTIGIGITVRAQHGSSVRIRSAGSVGRRMRMLTWVGTRCQRLTRLGLDHGTRSMVCQILIGIGSTGRMVVR